MTMKMGVRGMTWLDVLERLHRFLEVRSQKYEAGNDHLKVVSELIRQVGKNY
jgi:hypothetical protein